MAGRWAGSSMKTARRFPPRHELVRADRRRARASAHRLPAPICCGRSSSSIGPPGGSTLLTAWKHASILAQAYRHGIPMTVHPGIGYDIISNHPVFSGAAIGRAAEWDFKLFGGSVQDLDGGVVLSVGSAIMGPQVFEKALSCVNNLRLQSGRDIVRGHTFYVVDLQDGGRLGLDRRRAPQDESRLLPSFLQELFADGRCAQLRAVRQHDVHPSSLSPVERDMNNERFHAVADRYPRLRIGVVGDFFLDRYLHIDPAKAETSIETGLPVHNVVQGQEPARSGRHDPQQPGCPGHRRDPCRRLLRRRRRGLRAAPGARGPARCEPRAFHHVAHASRLRFIASRW